MNGSGLPAARDGASLVVAEVTLCSTTVALAWGFARLFTSAEFVPRALLIAVAAHLACALARRTSLRLWVAIPMLVALGALVVCWVHLRGSLSFGLPTVATIDEGHRLLKEAFSPFRRLVAPVEMTAGFELALGIGVWVLALFADEAAFSGDAPLQALVPHMAVFVGSSVFARHHGDVVASASLILCVLAFLAAHRALRASRFRWVQSERGHGARHIFVMGSSLAAVVVAAASLIGPRLPGASSESWVDLRSLGQESGPVEVGNPLIGVGNLLGPQSDQLMFTVDASAPHYWRLTSLGEYDPSSQQWRTRRSYREIDSDERLPVDGPVPPSNREQARVELSGLSAIWLPVPFRPVSVRSEVDLRYDPGTSSIIASGRTTLPATVYEVTSEVPDISSDDLARRGGHGPGRNYSEDPRVAPAVAELTLAVTSGQTTDYGRMRALQDYFRSEFTYDAGVDYSHEADPTTAFLTARTGFCQQFASTFAVMARVLGVPSRVAVGFTYGEEVTGETDGVRRFEVRGRQAHAWPEVYLGDAGWVAFEPTPGRGNPDASQLTGVEAAQDTAARTDPEQSTPTTTPAPTTTLTTAPQSPEDRAPAPTVGTNDPGDSLPVAAVVAGVVVALLSAVLGVRLAWVRTRRRRRRGRGDPAGRVRGAWLDACEWLATVRLLRGDQETPIEFGSRAARIIELSELSSLAELETLRLFGDRPIEPAEADVAEAAASAVGAAVLAQIDRRGRVAHLLGVSRNN